ncbi:restriction endonuclease subunit S [Psychroserpens mesophilus]|uniref:restriction endonuclease subunit S n=1 Tax=Psychroserpens mesophilus TaxID=325473 RepID=UPI000693E9DE|nr:restriction endonuclease subunit S [Psychroserpens mesophilus]
MVETITKIQRYEIYKESGVEWLGEIPEHWELKRLKYVFTILKRISGELGHDVLSITQSGIKIKDIDSGSGQLSMDYSKYQLVFQGDFAMNHMDLLTGYVDLSKYDGVISPDYRVFNILDTNCDKDYLLILLQLGYQSKVFYAHGQGVSMLGRWRFPAENFNNFIFPIPPLTEQIKIAQFLDDKTTKIEDAIAINEQQISLLKERKQILIHKAVTRGLDDSVTLKDSGVEWIGEIPEHWEVKRFKFLCDITTGSKNTQDKVENGLYPFYVRSQIPEKINTYTFDGEAILTAGDGAGVGKVFHYLNEKFDFHQRVYKFSNFRNIEGKLLFYYLRSNFHSIALNGEAKSTVDSLRLPLIQNFMVTIPPKREQIEIINRIETASQKIETAIGLKQQEIEKLKEYKSSLINGVVTGKVKVC